MTSTSATARPLLARPAFWWGISALTLVVGYADLWRGGTTLAPILLVVAYCILIPVAILK